MARNQYGGDCYRCGRWVAPGTGHFEKVKGTRNGWRVQHCCGSYRNGVTCEMAHQRAREAAKAAAQTASPTPQEPGL